MKPCAKAGCARGYRHEFDQFLRDFEFAGDTQVLWDALDKDAGGFITAACRMFLYAHGDMIYTRKPGVKSIALNASSSRLMNYNFFPVGKANASVLSRLDMERGGSRFTTSVWIICPGGAGLQVGPG